MSTTNLLDKVFGYTTNNGLFSAPCHILIGLSGGADSMALLHVLTHWPSANLQISAVHIHHGLRGEDADNDEAFVRDYCAQINVPLMVVHVDIAKIAAEQKMSLEEAGRLARYEHFESIRCKIGADYIVTAHTASDQAETLVMHLIRGCGVDGLVGIPSIRDRIRRPLLCCHRQEIEEYCSANNIPFVTDATNYDDQYTRNVIRHRVLPLLRDINPSVDNALLRLSKCALEESSYLNELSVTALSVAACANGYCAEAFLEQSTVIRRRMIRLMLRESAVETIEEAHILAAEEVILRGNGLIDLVGPYVFSVHQGVVSVRKVEMHNECLPICIEKLPCTVDCCGKQYEISVLKDINENVHKLFVNFAVDYDRIQGGLCLRGRQVGDYLHASGRGVGKSLKKWMNEWHIPAYMRDTYPVLCDEAGVILVPGFACDERVRITEATKHFLVCKTVEEQG